MGTNVFVGGYLLVLVLSVYVASTWDWRGVTGFKNRLFKGVIHLPVTLLSSAIWYLMIIVIIHFVSIGTLFSGNPEQKPMIHEIIIMFLAVVPSVWAGYWIACDTVYDIHRWRMGRQGHA